MQRWIGFDSRLGVVHDLLNITGCSSEEECLAWNQEVGISRFPTLTKIEPA